MSLRHFKLCMLLHAVFMSVSMFSLQARTISGVVLSDNDSTAVAGAVCRLMANGKLVAGTATDTEGRFSLATDLKSAFALEIAMAGYNPTNIIIESGEKNIDLAAVFLSEGIVLDEVSVNANSVIESNGRTIVYPSAADLKASSTAISVFQKLSLAGLDANPINRSLTVDGGTPMILINGVPSTIDDVNSLRPNDIERIEYSRMTPARYADRGVNGFINIMLKKRTDGGQIFAWGRSAVTTAFVDANISGSYHQGPSQFSLFYSPSWRNYQSVYDNTVESFIGDDFRVNLEEHDRAPFYYSYHQVRLKYDYSPDANTLFSATFNAMPMNSKHRTIQHTIDSELGSYDNNNVSTSDDFAPSLDLFFRKDFNEKNSMEVQVVGTLSSSDYRRDNRYSFSDGKETVYTMNADNRRRSLISEISYTHNFSDKTSLSGGFQNTVSHSTNEYLLTDYKPVLTENNNYVYARLGQVVGNFYFSVATGAKLFWVKNDMNKRNFVRNLTSVQASWNSERHWSISGAFQYVPSIPSLAALTDYQQQSSPYLVSNGNPNLKVAEYFTYQLVPSFNYKKFNSSLLLAFTDMKNHVIDDMIYLGDGQFLSQSVNASSGHVFRSRLNLKISDIAGFGASVTLGVNHFNSAGDGWSHSLTSFAGSISAWWNKGPFTVSYWRKFPGKYLNGHYVGKEENGDALGLGYKPDKHWSFNMEWMYMFETKGTQYPAWNYSAVNPSYRERYIKNNGNMIVLSVSYSADFGAIFRSGRRTLNNADNGSSLLKM